MGAKIVRWIVGLAILAVTLGAHQQIPYVAPADRDEVFLPKPDLLKLGTFGFDDSPVMPKIGCGRANLPDKDQRSRPCYKNLQ